MEICMEKKSIFSYIFVQNLILFPYENETVFFIILILPVPRSRLNANLDRVATFSIFKNTVNCSESHRYWNQPKKLHVAAYQQVIFVLPENQTFERESKSSKESLTKLGTSIDATFRGRFRRCSSEKLPCHSDTVPPSCRVPKQPPVHKTIYED